MAFALLRAGSTEKHLASLRYKNGKPYSIRHDGTETLLPKGIKARAAKDLLDAYATKRIHIKLGLDVLPSTETVADASARFLEEIRHRRSYASIEGRWRLHIIPKLGKCVVSQVKPTQVEGVLNGLKDKGYSQQTRRHVRVTLGAFYRWLIRNGAVASSPVSKTDPIPVPEGAPKALTEEEVRRVAEAATFPGLKHLVLLGFYTGARPGELLAATWKVVDFEARTLRIRNTLGSETTKTGVARGAALPAPALELLAEMKRSARGQFLFLNADGNPMQLRQAARAFKTAVKRAGLVRGYEVVCRRKGCGFREAREESTGGACPKCRFKLYVRALPAKVSLKDLRSTSVTQIVERTGSLHVAAAQAGHASVKTTERHYVEKRQAFLSDAINRAFAPAPAAQPSDRDGPTVH